MQFKMRQYISAVDEELYVDLWMWKRIRCESCP